MVLRKRHKVSRIKLERVMIPNIGRELVGRHVWIDANLVGEKGVNNLFSTMDKLKVWEKMYFMSQLIKESMKR